ncbi:Hypothetical predicted protein [Olea europaea subsp. europaea]|uniref:Uncharacterized protein n=1 Tax=Olea europaea subsp. europaea TaxID=158383 RepID=A0A8S0R9Q0_OLEEU|nr:Hypothetical predicted protein [Olea europaea subsp. europaea]
MDISGRCSRDKRKGKQRREKGKKKRYNARDVSTLLEQMVSVETDLASIARSHSKGGMSVVKCVEELLSSGYVTKGDVVHPFGLWLFHDKDNQIYAAKTPLLCFKFVEYCFRRDNLMHQRKG